MEDEDDVPWGGLIANDANGIAKCVNRLMCDDDLWLRCQSKGSELLSELYDFETQGAARWQNFIRKYPRQRKARTRQ